MQTSIDKNVIKSNKEDVIKIILIETASIVTKTIKSIYVFTLIKKETINQL